jgi:hypothetical protein
MYKVSLHPMFVKYETKLIMVKYIDKGAGYRIFKVSILFLFVSMWAADDFVSIQCLFCGTQID